MQRKPKIIDLFSGAGGLSLGFEMAGFESVLAVDNNQDAINTYNHNFKNKVGVTLDIQEINKNYVLEKIKAEKIDGIIGGPPCQGFSNNGKRDINDPRNFLYLEYCRIVEELNPNFFVIENVKGILSMNNKSFVNDIYERFQNLGYKVNHQVLNSSNYGVPQNRERVFFVGIKDKAFQFPTKENNIITTLEALSDLPLLDNLNEHKDIFDYETEPLNEYQRKMRKGSTLIHNHNFTNHSEQTKKIISMVPDGGSVKDLPKEFWEIQKYNSAFKRMNSQKPSATIDTGHRRYYHYQENRVPSVRESARIQSFPDNFVFLGSKTSQYKQVGNAVPPFLSFSIAKELKKYL